MQHVYMRIQLIRVERIQSFVLLWLSIVYQIQV